VAEYVMQTILDGSLNGTTIRKLARTALNFPMPLVQIQENLFVLELFRGPTLAFKDVGARFLAGLLTRLHERDDPVTTILTATSGDTGGAVAQAFHGIPGTRVVVLFPDGKVTSRQERQFSTLGGNVTAVAVQGDFDACQRLAKEAFREFGSSRAPLAANSSRLTSANSINVGRFLPQTTYFVYLWAQLVERMDSRTKILVSVPSGNFGNLAAGLLAKAMGLKQLRFLAATNRNDVVPRYLDTGVFTPRPSVPTLSTAMDVGNPSNLDRIRHLYGEDVKRLRRDVLGHRVSDRETRDCIGRVHRETGYTLDPHSAVGFVALEEGLRQRPDSLGVLLATAHPAKFSEVVEPVIGGPLPVPSELERCLRAPRTVVPMEPRLEALDAILRSP
jgi:threonine synthase